MGNKQTVKTASKIIASLCLFLILVAAIGVIIRFTSGFTSDFKTFYVTVEDKDVLESEKGYQITLQSPLHVTVKYTFESINKDISGYSVKVVPNKIADNDFNFTLDGQPCFYQAEKDLTAGFKIEQGDTSFTIKPKGDFLTILQAVHPSCKIDNYKNKGYSDMYALIVTSYNGQASIKLCFSIPESLSGVVLDPDEVVF